MSTRWTCAEAIAWEMASQRTFGRVVVRDPLHPADVAGDIHGRLARMGRDAICLHAASGLGIVHAVALEHEDTALIVTTAGADWRVLAESRAWCERGGSMMFVMPQRALDGVDPQVATLLSVSRAVFFSAVDRRDPRARALLDRAREILAQLMDPPVSRLRLHSRDIGLDTARINFDRAAIDVAFDYLEEADRSLLLIPAFERLQRDYPRPEVDDLLRAMRALYLGDE